MRWMKSTRIKRLSPAALETFPPPSKGLTEKGGANEIVEGELDSQHFARKGESNQKLTENRQALR